MGAITLVNCCLFIPCRLHYINCLVPCCLYLTMRFLWPLQEVKGRGFLLVSTDIASRGFDLPQTSHIYNFDLPKTATDYLHRAGRTGREPFSRLECGVTTLITDEEHFVLQRFQNELKFHCEELPLESMFTFSWARMWILAFSSLFLGTATGDRFFSHSLWASIQGKNLQHLYLIRLHIHFSIYILMKWSWIMIKLVLISFIVSENDSTPIQPCSLVH